MSSDKLYPETQKESSSNHALAGLLLEEINKQSSEKSVIDELHVFVDVLDDETGELETRLVLL